MATGCPFCGLAECTRCSVCGGCPRACLHGEEDIIAELHPNLDKVRTVRSQLWSAPRNPLRIRPKVALDAPEKMFSQFDELLRELPVSLTPGQRSEIAAALVLYAHLWNAVQEWRELWNLVARTLAALRPSTMRSILRGNARSASSLLDLLEELRSAPNISVLRNSHGVENDLPGTPLCFQSQVNRMRQIVASQGPQLLAEAAEFALLLRRQATNAVGKTTSIFVDIPRLGRFLVGDKRRLQANEAGPYIAHTLVEALVEMRGSSRNSTEDAITILTRAMPRVFDPERIEDEAFRRNRYRERARHSQTAARACGVFVFRPLAAQLLAHIESSA